MSELVDPKLRVTRNQLSKMSQDSELIKQFEKLFSYINELYPGALERLDDLESRVDALENP